MFKFDVVATHQKAMDTQIAQIVQQVSRLSQPQEHLPCQSKINPKGHINIVSIMREGLDESPMMIL